MNNITRDSLFDGALRLQQPARGSGYRVNVDAVLLAAFAAHALEGVGSEEARPHPRRHAVDLGAGVGAVGLTLLHLGAARRLTLVDSDLALASLATANAAENGWSERVAVVAKDVAEAAEALAATADLVVCNPPYVDPGRGREPAERHRAARYGELETFIAAARRIAGRRARVCFVYPAGSAVTLFATLSRHGLEPKRLRAVHARVDDPARVVLVEAVAGKPGGLVIEAPTFELDDDGTRSNALVRLLSAPRSSSADVTGGAGDRARSRTRSER